MTQPSTQPQDASSRHWLYGFNFAALVVVGLFALGLICYITSKYSKHIDMTANGLYSLSPETKNLVKEIGAQKQTYTIMSIFPPSNDDAQEQKRTQINDLLAEYARTSGNITIDDKGDVTRDVIEKPIRDMYAAELKPYADAVGEVDKVMNDVIKFCTAEGANIDAVAQKPGVSAVTVQQAAQAQGLFAKALPDEFSRVQDEIHRQTDSTTPDWKATADTVKGMMDKLQDQFKPFADPKQLTELTPDLIAYFTSAQTRYKAILAEISGYEDKLGALPPLKVADILAGIQGNSLVILGAHEAKVVSPTDIFQPAGTQAHPELTNFTGEQAISSALLSMVRPDKVKVVFITAAPTQILESQFTEIAKSLKDYNFDPMEWSPPAPPTGPDSPPSSPTPPAEGKGVVWIVFPPDAPSEQQMMMGTPPPNPQPINDAVKKHMDEGGQVFFLAEAAGAMNPFAGAAPTGYAYQDLLKDFGIDVQTKFSVMHQESGQDPDTGQSIQQTTPAIDIQRFPNTPITASLESMETYFAPLQTQGGYAGFPTIVAKSNPLPSNVEAQVIVETPDTPDYWGAAELKQNATYIKGVDSPSPVPMGVMAIRNKGDKNKEARIVVIGCKLFAADPIIRASQAVLVGDHISSFQRFPGNSALFINCVRWLAGYENMIAVGPKANAALRIRDISPTAMAVIQWGVLYVGAPLAALLLGGVVWFFRRR